MRLSLNYGRFSFKNLFFVAVLGLTITFSACIQSGDTLGNYSDSKADITLIDKSSRLLSESFVSLPPDDVNEDEAILIQENKVEHAEPDYNLVKNSNGLNGVEGWRVTKEKGNGFFYQGKNSSNLESGKYFGTSYGWSVKRQIIDLEAECVMLSLSMQA